MAFGDYTQLQAEIQSFLWDRTDVVAKIPTFITLAEAEMKRLLKTQQAVVSRPMALSAGNGVGGLPGASRKIRSVVLNEISGNGTFELDYATPEAMAGYNFVNPARPRFYTIEGDRLRILPLPDQAYTGTVHYRSVFDPLADTNTTNWVLEQHPDIYLSGALKYAKMWLIDQDQDWGSVFYGAIDQANQDEPMIQTNSTLRADEVSAMGNRSGYNIYTDGYGRPL